MRHGFMTLAAIAIVGVGAATPGLAQGKAVRTISDGIIDEAKLYIEKLPAATVVVIRPFSATDADIVEGDKSKEVSLPRPAARHTRTSVDRRPRRS